MFHVHSSCMSNMKNIKQYLIKGGTSSKYRIQPGSKKSNVNDILNWLSIVWNVRPLF